MAKRGWKSSSNRIGQNSVPVQYNSPWDAVKSDALAWNDFISGLGMRMQHWSYIPYVLGASDVGMLRFYESTPVPPSQTNNFIYDNNGIYKYEGDVFVIWQSNSKQLTMMPAGYYPQSNGMVTINRHYIDSERIVGLSEFDKLIPVINGDPLEYASVNWEKIQHNPTGIDRLMFQAVLVEHLIDANGVQYTQNIDFVLDNGYIKWLNGGKRPGLDPNTGIGMIYAIRYRYVPSFYIKYAAHELRSHATLDPNTGETKMIRGPMTAMVQIDWVFLQSISDQQSSQYGARMAGDGGNTGPR